eukprot:Gregarina_sp_Poly_1__9769@NODE_622_length_7094_cov_92_849580_g477_i0_p4_GENE_NODE_622_length_7094_cov_92_849580_g477_i0NODE_622_length_7094_cov_92_849580_g477_i0_p4_ORF_typecomplete_len298_score27_45Galactosyl_T/PF01762_21/4_9e34Fringe/PF02434_16/1_7e07_NODE_622_length_7094_cov_92_849580_g477_i034494342
MKLFVGIVALLVQNGEGRWPFPDTLVSPNPCNANIRLLMIIHSIPDQHAQRATLRRRHMDKGDEARLIFALGLRSQAINDAVFAESNKTKDILLLNYTDSAEQLPQKSMAGLQWFLESCPDTKFYIKTDDDVVWNWRTVNAFLDELEKAPYGRSIWVGYRFDQHHLTRRHKEVYMNGPMPAYVAGGGYLMNRHVASLAVEQAKYTPIIMRTEDAFLGVLLEPAGVYPTHNRRIVMNAASVKDMYKNLTKLACHDWMAVLVERESTRQEMGYKNHDPSQELRLTHAFEDAATACLNNR